MTVKWRSQFETVPRSLFTYFQAFTFPFTRWLDPFFFFLLSFFPEKAHGGNAKIPRCLSYFTFTREWYFKPSLDLSCNKSSSA